MTSLRPSGRTGFTLIELLIVVVIIGILAAIGVARFERVRQRGMVAAVQSDLRQLAVQQERYHMANYSYTNTLGDLEFEQSSGVTITINTADNTGWAATGEHAGDGDIACGIFVGSATAADAAPATNPEVVECTF